jgi:glycosyltransferase 2 family protein
MTGTAGSVVHTGSVPWWRRPLVRLVFLVVAAGGLVWALSDQWRSLQEALAASAQSVDIAWGWVLGASLVVLATHAMLVHSWRLLLRGWRAELPYWHAVQIWTIANLGKWIPGKVWQVGALGLMAVDRGVSGVVAAGAALLGTLLNIGAGFGLVVLLGSSALDAIRLGLKPIAIALSIGFVLVVIALPSVVPRVTGWIARRRGRTRPPERPLPATTLWLATALNVLAWALYGIGFALLAKGVTPMIQGTLASFVVVYTASYLAGYLVLLAPGGLVVRELVLVALLVGTGMAGKGDALLLSAVSRLWITILEVAPGVVSLLLLSPTQRAALRGGDTNSDG